MGIDSLLGEKKYSHRNLSSRYEEVLMLPDGPAEDYSLFKDGNRFGFFRNSDFVFGGSPGSAFPIGEFFGYSKALIIDFQGSIIFGLKYYSYQFSDQCYLALKGKEGWCVFAFDRARMGESCDGGNLPGLSLMVENAESMAEAVDGLAAKIGILLSRWYDFSSGEYAWIDSIEREPVFAEPSPDRIDTLAPNQVFVFGSNLAGAHGGGAAALAHARFGAVWGQGSGLQGRSYAIPTMQGPADTVKPYVDEFLAFAKDHPELEFLVTRIGCGIAGFTDAQMAPLFKGAAGLSNVRLPESFLAILKSKD